MKKRFIVIFFLGFSSLTFCQDIHKTDELKLKLQQQLVDTTRISIHLKIGKLYRDSNLDSSLIHYNKALSLSKKNNSEFQIAESLSGIGVYYQINGNYDNAIIHYNEAIIYFQKLNNKKRVAHLNNDIGYNYSKLYADNKAVEYYLKSLAIFKIISDDEGIARNYNAFGNLYYTQENYEVAKKYYNDASNIYKKLDNKLGTSYSYISLGNVVSEQGDFEKGFEYYNKSIAIQKEINDSIGISFNENNIGYSYLMLNEYQKSLFYFEKALKTLKNSNYVDFESLIHLNIAQSQNKLKNYNKAIISGNKSLELSNKSGNLENQTNGLKNLSIAYEGIHNNLKALEYLKLSLNIRDTIISKDKANKAQLLHALNQLDKSQYTIDDLSNKAQIANLKSANEKRIRYVLILAIIVFLVLIVLLVVQRTAKRKAYNLLSFKNRQINRMNDEIWNQRENLRQLNNTKDKLFSIIAHDLKNPFNAIIGFTEFMIEKNSEYDEEKRLKFLNIIKKSAANTSDLLENLLNWANFQRGELEFTPEKIELINEVTNVISLVEVQAINKNIKIENNVESGIYVEADLNMLNTILRNLISNAIKFTEANGEIQISVSINSNFAKITVKDNGVGIAQSNIDNLFSIEVKNPSVGTANELGSGLGLILCKDFVEKHGGKLWVESSVNEGSEFKFTLPIAI